MINLIDKEIWEEFFDWFIQECEVLYDNGGFNYDIPKEAQIKASLYSFLKSKRLIAEIESNIFIKNPNPHQAMPRFDMRVLFNDYDVLIEIKRTTALDNWNNDFTNFLRGWEADIDKMDCINDEENYKRGKIKKNVKKCFILFIFTNKNEESEKLHTKLVDKISEFDKYVRDRWENAYFFKSEFALLGKYTSGYDPQIPEKEAVVQLMVWVKG